MNYKSFENDSLGLDEDSPFFFDHVTRYWWAGDIARDRHVLDCATGKGYGAYIMSQNAKTVTGIDLNDESLRIAQNTFKSENLEYKKWDAFKLGDMPHKFDVVTAFEVIEHIPEETTDAFLASIHSALKEGGKLLLSTPNHDVVTKSRCSIPSFHINNFHPVTLKKFLEKHFSNVMMIGQYRPKGALYNAVFSMDFFNMRHSLRNIMKPPSTVMQMSETEDHGVVDEEQLNNLPAFENRPDEFYLYRFSPNHWRQAGLTVAICTK